jgi:type VI secretion system protein ImpF
MCVPFGSTLPSKLLRNVLMARALFLPSLLDRLTDDDPINKSIRLQKEKILDIERTLAKLLAEKNPADVEASQKQRKQLMLDLDQARAQFIVLSAALSSSQEIRACVKRDMDWLLNASQFEPQQQLIDYPEVARSVLNYGMPDLTGKSVSGFDLIQMERLLKEVILNFEPRIIPRSLSVRLMGDKKMYDHNALGFEIEGDLWSEPQPIHMHLRTEFELDDGTVSVDDYYPT